MQWENGLFPMFNSLVKEKYVPKMIELMMAMMWGMDSKMKTDTHK
jgi:hypothetical protein